MIGYDQILLSKYKQHGHIAKMSEVAEIVGYPYFEWNGRLYVTGSCLDVHDDLPNVLRGDAYEHLGDAELLARSVVLFAKAVEVQSDNIMAQIQGRMPGFQCVDPVLQAEIEKELERRKR